MSEEDSFYNVPMLYGEQSRAATANECIQLVMYLDKVMDQVFDTITKRIESKSNQYFSNFVIHNQLLQKMPVDLNLLIVV